ncbi:MAG: hypothetical protein EZS28_003938 [Streblomastix strix]|uniref:Uncharacterized protein n=1 Tax=Streblomastix strix TaxID=222440 RepID=A0A5J4X014_9EUKA|nr:MAG: hypothetical protein EZS28_003938 [Streblomastix strix]
MQKALQKLAQFPAHPGGVNAVALAQNAALVATGGQDNKTCIWSIRKLQEKSTPMMTLLGHSSPVTCVAFDQTEARVASGNVGGGLRVWDISAGKSIKIFSAGIHHQAVSCLNFNANGQHLTTGSNDMSVKVWDMRHKQVVQSYKIHSNNVNAALFSPDGKYLFTGGEDGICNVVDLGEGKVVKQFSHDGPINTIALHPLDLIMATGSSDRTSKVYDLSSFQIVASIPMDSTKIRSLQFCGDDGDVLCTVMRKISRQYCSRARSKLLNLGKAEMVKCKKLIIPD